MTRCRQFCSSFDHASRHRLTADFCELSSTSVASDGADASHLSVLPDELVGGAPAIARTSPVRTDRFDQSPLNSRSGYPGKPHPPNFQRAGARARARRRARAPARRRAHVSKRLWTGSCVGRRRGRRSVCPLRGGRDCTKKPFSRPALQRGEAGLKRGARGPQRAIITCTSTAGRRGGPPRRPGRRAGGRTGACRGLSAEASRGCKPARRSAAARSGAARAASTAA